MGLFPIYVLVFVFIELINNSSTCSRPISIFCILSSNINLVTTFDCWSKRRCFPRWHTSIKILFEVVCTYIQSFLLSRGIKPKGTTYGWTFPHLVKSSRPNWDKTIWLQCCIKSCKCILDNKTFDVNFMHKGGWYVNNQIPCESTLVNALNWTYIHL
jgi:hypothetical protein